MCLFIHYGSTVIPKNQNDKISPTSQLNSPSIIKYNNIHLKSKTEMGKVKDNSGKLQEERKTITETNGVYSPIAMGSRAKNYQNMAKKEKETKQKVEYNLLGPKVITEKSSESGMASQKGNKLLNPKIKREAEYFLSVTKRESKTNKSSTLALEESTLEYEKSAQMISNSASKYNSTAVQNILITKAHSNSDTVSETQVTLDVSQKEIWFISDEGSDRYDCQTESTPCKNLQTVLDRASDGAEIYVTSETLSLDLVDESFWYKMAFWKLPINGKKSCLINSSLSYTLRSISGTKTNIICSSKYFTIKTIKCITCMGWPILMKCKRSNFKFKQNYTFK